MIKMTDDRRQRLELGSGTRRRPIGRDYAGAKDAECGMMESLRSVGLYD